ncbi:hypothetical protein [Nannocystis sp.]|uniref:hypothetical protein n=1 Tax=Nannocystis sp. TaxID=1962667 RepID=UPI0025E22FDB|nr:hypothetical protein [Nannocystis sp.]MBK7828400.1 hypothetical protein [Nannocystis sp.]
MATPRRPNPTPIPIPTPTPAPGDVRPPRAPTTAWDHANAELAALDASLPVALLPVRIETRFLGGDLVIRVYPDGLHADALKHSLTDAERNHADTFWRDSRADAAAELAAWRALIDAVSSPWRAAWVIRATRGGASPQIEEREAVTTLRLLPKRWIVIGTLGGKQVVQAAGREIPANLIGGVDLNVQATSADALLNQPATSWVVDLDQAIAQGMALRIPPTGEAELVRTKGIDTLLVFGASAVSPEDQRTALAKLFLAHHYTRGVGLLRQGEPTNRDEHDADLLRPDVAKLRAREQATRTSSPQFTAFNGPAASALARALGLDSTQLPILDGENDREQEFASAMNTIVWPITGGAILWHLRDAKGKQLVSGDDIKELRTHFIRDVRGAGPLPTLRIGKTPYGILPACALPEPVDGTSLHARLQSALHGLLAKWQKGAADLTTVDSRADDTTSDTPREHALVEVLASQAWPTRFALRKLDPDSPMATEAAKAKPQLPEGTLALYAIRLGLLFTAGMKLEDLPPFGPFSLYPALCDYEEHVIPWARTTAELPPTTPTEPGIRGAPDKTDPLQPIRQPLVGPVVSLLDQILRIGRSLLRDDDHPASEEDRASERAAIDAAVVVLRSAPEADRARILGQSLSLAATRLDAWITATATRRLVELRAKRPTDLQVGAWGVVHGLRPAGDTPPGGYALAPSLGQAAAAVALRSGHAAYSINGSSPFAVDLSSERVRLARWLYDGVRQGQSLGALLGQRYERLLHEHGADTLVAVTRSAALKARHRDDPPVHVVDGLLVARARPDHRCDGPGAGAHQVPR